MTNHERLTEQYEDALFALLMDSVAEEEGKQALELNERLKADPAAEVPESARRRCEATIRREFNRKRAKKLGKVTWKVVRRVSVAVILMVVLLTTAMAASEQFRLGVLNAVINTYDRYTELTFKGEDEVAPRDPTPEEAEQNEDWTYYYGVGFEWIPEGYEVGDDGWSRTNGTRGLSLYDGAGHAIDVDAILPDVLAQDVTQFCYQGFLTSDGDRWICEVEGETIKVTCADDREAVPLDSNLWVTRSGHLRFQGICSTFPLEDVSLNTIVPILRNLFFIAIFFEIWMKIFVGRG